jgi:hypothetical protein
MSEEKCGAGCQRFYGGEIKHIKECVFYPDSLSEMRDQLQSQLAAKDHEIEKVKADWFDEHTARKSLNSQNEVLREENKILCDALKLGLDLPNAHQEPARARWFYFVKAAQEALDKVKPKIKVGTSVCSHGTPTDRSCVHCTMKFIVD